MTPESVKMAQMRHVPAYELESRPGPPSRMFREMEADLISELARQATLHGRRFVGWPNVEFRTNVSHKYLGGVEIIATVEAR